VESVSVVELLAVERGIDEPNGPLVLSQAGVVDQSEHGADNGSGSGSSVDE